VTPLLVMIVEDNEQNRLLMEEVLSSEGYLLLFAEDGERAITLLGEWRPHLILLDLGLPRIDGYGVLNWVRSTPELAEVPVLAVTAHVLLEEQERIRAAGFDGLISKPFDIHALREAVRAHVRSGV